MIQLERDTLKENRNLRDIWRFKHCPICTTYMVWKLVPLLLSLPVHICKLAMITFPLYHCFESWRYFKKVPCTLLNTQKSSVPYCYHDPFYYQSEFRHKETEPWWGKELGREHKGSKWQNQHRVYGLWIPIIIPPLSLHGMCHVALSSKGGGGWGMPVSLLCPFFKMTLREKRLFLMYLSWKGIHCLDLCLLFWTLVT